MVDKIVSRGSVCMAKSYANAGAFTWMVMPKDKPSEDWGRKNIQPSVSENW
ncbi:MAG TPA: hypothetical protein PKA27_02410 [Fimbriimonadaceae bacterium]|nr:hypothetical protein [Fimbriimonadaceae bacterium]